MKFILNNIEVEFDPVEQRMKDWPDPLIMQEWQEEIIQVVKEWLSPAMHMSFVTSGSTGDPKTIRHRKAHMRMSAVKTIDFFDLSKGHTALLCLPVRFIAGTMMIIRAMEANMDLFCVPPTSNPLADVASPIDFAAMTPHQLDCALSNSPGRMKYIRQILLGGGGVSARLEKDVCDMKINASLGYGMTETITHIALRSLDGKTPFYSALPGVRFKTDEYGCLVVMADHLEEREIVTRDVVHLRSETTFEWLGRRDRVINTGGLKIFPELMEEKLDKIISNRFFIAAEEDDRYGKRPALFLEGRPLSPIQFNELVRKMATLLSKYEMPENIYFVTHFIETPTGKIRKDPNLYRS